MITKTALFIKRDWDRVHAKYELTIKPITVIENITVETFVNQGLCSKEYTPKKGDKLFFLPGCSIPRFKMKKFCEEYGTAMVKYKTSATAVFAGPDTLRDLVTYTPGWKFDKSYVAAYFSNYASAELISMINSTTSECVYTDSSGTNSEMTKVFGGKFVKDAEWVGSVDVMFKTDAEYETFKYLQTAENIYDQKDVARKLNTGAEMTEEQYLSIQRLLESSDDTNTKVAIEIMSNCDFEKSAVYLLLLIKEYGLQIYSCPTSNHVNFKSLLKFFGIQNMSHYHLDHIVDTLLSRKLLSRSNLNTLIPFAKEQLSASAGLQHFFPVGLTYSEEIEKGLQENILEPTHDTEILSEEAETLYPRI